MIQQPIAVNFQKMGVLPQIKAKQFDDDLRVIKVQLLEGATPFEVPEGFEVNIKARKPDGKRVLNPCTFRDSVVDVLLTRQMMAAAGMLECEIQVINHEGEVKTATFAVDIQPSVFHDKELASTHEYLTMQQILKLVQEAEERVRTMETHVEALRASVEEQIADAHSAFSQLKRELVTQVETAITDAKGEVSAELAQAKERFDGIAADLTASVTGVIEQAKQEFAGDRTAFRREMEELAAGLESRVATLLADKQQEWESLIAVFTADVDAAARAANDAADRADIAIAKADDAADNADKAAESATEAANDASNAASDARDAAERANGASGSVEQHMLDKTNPHAVTAAQAGAVALDKMGTPMGVATLDDNGKVVQTPIASQIVDIIYPVGAIYMSWNNVDPTALFGGSWTAIENRFLVAAGSTYSGGSTGGSATHTHGSTGAASGNTGATAITVNQMPKHEHPVNVAAKTGGNASWATIITSGHSDNATFYRSGTAISVGGGATHTHTLNSHTHTTTSASSLPPYSAVYVWRRTA